MERFTEETGLGLHVKAYVKNQSMQKSKEGPLSKIIKEQIYLGRFIAMYKFGPGDGKP